jgi:hypothetical protein
VFPRLSPQELRALADDIKEHGLQVPITTWTDPATRKRYVLDGRNRLDAKALLAVDEPGFGWEPVDAYVKRGKRRFALKLGYGEHEHVSHASDPTLEVISLNIKRRHLTAQERGEYALKAIEAGQKYNSERPSKNERSVGGKQGGSTKGLTGQVMEAAGISRGTALKVIGEQGEHIGMGQWCDRSPGEPVESYNLRLAAERAVKYRDWHYREAKERVKGTTTADLWERLQREHAEQKKGVTHDTAHVAEVVALTVLAVNRWCNVGDMDFLGIHDEPAEGVRESVALTVAAGGFRQRMMVKPPAAVEDAPAVVADEPAPA